MTFRLKTVRRIVTFTAIMVATAHTAAAQQMPLIVGNDRGGYVAIRAQEVDRLKLTGQPVEIRGNICYSTCTMYLGAPNVCISPNTTFGFHGPSLGGIPLEPRAFDLWSQVMANHYSPPLRQWFMSQGRYVIDDLYRVSGRQLAAYGYQTCQIS